MTTHIGFTGTRHGMTPGQRAAVAQLIAELASGVGFTAHHGDCVGAGAEFHDLCRAHAGSFIGIHRGPLGDVEHQAGCVGDEQREPLPHATCCRRSAGTWVNDRANPVDRARHRRPRHNRSMIERTGSPDEGAAPDPVVEVVTSYLEMHARPVTALAPPPVGVQVVRARNPSTRFYRYLYDAVGGPWHWYDRRHMAAEELAAILADDAVEVHVLWKDGVPVGYAELDRRSQGEVELAYFGLVPEAIGQKLGPWLLAWSIHEAWRPHEVRRLWVHTCTLDHPSALCGYLAAGFVKYGEARHQQAIPAI